MSLETPQILNQTYSSNTIDASSLMVNAQADLKYRPPKQFDAGILDQYRGAKPDPDFHRVARDFAGLGIAEIGAAVGARTAAVAGAIGVGVQQQEEEMGARIVRVFIADSDENLPVETRLIHKGEEKLTDATDQELFFEVEIKALLDKHNEKRLQTLDKKATAKAGKDIFLEPIKIRDLKMVVVNVAAF